MDTHYLTQELRELNKHMHTLAHAMQDIRDELALLRTAVTTIAYRPVEQRGPSSGAVYPHPPIG